MYIVTENNEIVKHFHNRQEENSQSRFLLQELREIPRIFLTSFSNYSIMKVIVALRDAERIHFLPIRFV